MTSIIGIPTTRVSDLFIRQRLLTQVQGDQIDLARIQTQLSTGRRFELPSEDSVASMQVISLQSLLERKDQVKSNLSTNQSFLTTTDTTLSTVSGIIAEARATAMGVMGTTSSDVQRQAAAQQIDQAIQQLLDAGNQNFRGRYLFAGSATDVRPFEFQGAGVVKYLGNEKRLSSFADIDLLFDTNVTGSEAFGAISRPVLGSRDLDPALTFDARLADLKDGQGVRLGSIDVYVDTTKTTVDLSKASSIGDVAAMIHAQTNGAVDVQVAAKGLVLEAPGALTIKEVGSGRTASDLGILRETPAGNVVVGQPLNPALKGTTSLADILGVRASASIRPGPPDNDMIIEAAHNGADLNGVQITFVDDGTVTEHVNERATYTVLPDGTKTLVVTVASERSNAADVVAAINRGHDADPVAMPFTARLDPLDDVDGGKGVIVVTPPGELAGTTSGGEGYDFDKTSGMQIVNGGKTYAVDFQKAATVEDLLNVLNSSEAGVLAEINASATGINVRSRISGADFAIGENGGRTATDLGLRTLTEQTELADLNFGRGVTSGQTDGTYAGVKCLFGGPNNDLDFNALHLGPDWNDFTITFEDNLPPGNDGLTYDPVGKTMTFEITAGTTTANDIIQMVRANEQAAADFQVALDETNGANNGTGPVPLGTWLTSGGSPPGTDFTITRKDGVTFGIRLADAAPGGAKTIGDVLRLINDNPVNCSRGIKVRAQLAAYGNGIELVDDDPALQTLTVTRVHMSFAAWDLGLIPEKKEQSDPPGTGLVGRADVVSANPNSSLVFSAKTPGTWAGSVHVLFQDTGTEGVHYDKRQEQLIFNYDAGVTTAARIKELLESDPDAGAAFCVAYAPANPPSQGQGIFAPAAPDVPMTVVPMTTRPAPTHSRIPIGSFSTSQAKNTRPSRPTPLRAETREDLSVNLRATEKKPVAEVVSKAPKSQILKSRRCSGENMARPWPSTFTFIFWMPLPRLRQSAARVPMSRPIQSVLSGIMLSLALPSSLWSRPGGKGNIPGCPWAP